MALTSTITPYNPDWPDQYRYEASRLKPVFGRALVDFHHVGSTAIQDLNTKPEIDMLAVVEHTADVDEWSDILMSLRYRRGGDLSEGHLFFKRESGGVRTHKLHVCVASHPKISEMLKFRDFLRAHQDAKDEYQALKLQLERENTAGIAQYLRGKEPFIRSILRELDKRECLCCPGADPQNG